ncbi:Target of EGR1, member 1 (Nuclear) [Actinomortierella ambigua]|nr:Target of EGR1, member 1 (Nuclear) [Actinomortierella ambigua]
MASIPTHNQVTRDNLAEMQPKVVELLKQATFIAIDVEFTGFGDNIHATKASNVQERYENLCSIAKSHALIAFGLSIFIKKQQQHNTEQHSAIDDHQSVGEADQKDKNADHSHDNLIPHGDCGWERAFVVHNFNFSMLKNHDFSMTPSSMRFLAETGVDLNQWAKEGILYKDGNDTESSGKDDSTAIMRAIIRRIMTRHVPVVIHNGFLDLIFLYQSFYLTLPAKLSTFTADLSDMFSAGIYDTKFISDYVTHERVSFLSYLFRKYERADTQIRLKLASAVPETAHQHGKEHSQDDQHEDKEGSSSHLEGAKKGSKKSKKPLVFSTFDIQERLPLSSPTLKRTQPIKQEGLVDICEHFALHGHCRNGIRCEKSHDLDAILDHEENKHKKASKKHRTGSVSEVSQKESDKETTLQATTMPATAITPTVVEDTAVPAVVAVPTIENSALTPEKFHSAYFDAYMTGTVFSHQLNLHTRAVIEKEARSRVYLIGKSFPLVIEKSSYAQYSPGHLQKSRGSRAS